METLISCYKFMNILPCQFGDVSHKSRHWIFLERLTFIPLHGIKFDQLLFQKNASMTYHHKFCYIVFSVLTYFYQCIHLVLAIPPMHVATNTKIL